MSASTVSVLACVGFVVLAGIVIIASTRRNQTNRAIGVLSSQTRRRDKGHHAMGRVEGRATTSGRALERAAELDRRRAGRHAGGGLSAAGSAAAEPWVPPDDAVLGATRRQFLNRGITGFFAIGLASFGAAIVAFLWPKVGGGFGAAIRVGNVDELLSEIKDNNGFLYKPEGRMWITAYPSSALDKAREVYSQAELAGMSVGVLALYQKCPHLGCRVPGCVTSQWFECPCHGSKYNQVGEKKGGPAPRGMDRFAMSVSGGVLTVDTGTIIPGPTIGTNTTGQEAEGPHCIGASETH